jgi:hypothetical protein
MSKKWIGVDFDATLAEYHQDTGLPPPGKPIPKMVNRVKKWLADGKDVRIMTARMNPINHAPGVLEEQRTLLGLWCIEHLGQRLPLTYMKDYLMEELWDDRAIQLIPNTGERADGKE